MRKCNLIDIHSETWKWVILFDKNCSIKIKINKKEIPTFVNFISSWFIDASTINTFLQYFFQHTLEYHLPTQFSVSFGLDSFLIFIWWNWLQFEIRPQILFPSPHGVSHIWRHFYDLSPSQSNFCYRHCFTSRQKQI